MRQLLSVILIISALESAVHAQHTIHFTVNSHQPPVLIASAGADAEFAGVELTLGANPTAVGGLNPYTYLWFPATGLDDTASANPVYNEGQEQEFHLLLTDGRGCTATDSIDISVNITSLSSSGFDHLLVVYPNPTSASMRLAMKQNSDFSSANVLICDLSGKAIAVKQWKNTNFDLLLDVSTFPAGEFILTVVEGKNQISRNIIIHK